MVCLDYEQNNTSHNDTKDSNIELNDSITILSIITQHNDAKQNDTQVNATQFIYNEHLDDTQHNYNQPNNTQRNDSPHSKSSEKNTQHNDTQNNII